ncbi:unnamed protein product [Closterium sp. NIES-53]
MKSEVTSTLMQWLLATEGTRGSRVHCLHSDCGGDFHSGVLAGFCDEQGIRQSWTLPESPQQNGFVERRIGLVMDIARTSMIHARAPHFLWPYALRYAAHQLNLQPTYSRDVRFDESVSYYTRYPCRGLPVPPPPLFPTPSPPPALAPPVPPPPPGPAPSARGAAAGGTRSGGARSRGAGAGGAGAGGASSGGAGAGGSGTGGAISGGAGAGGVGAGGASSGGAGAGGAGTRGASSQGARAGGAGTGGASYGGAGTGGAGAEQEQLEQERKELQKLDQQQQQQTPQPQLLQQLFPPMRGLRALGLPSSPPVHSQSPTTYGPTFPPKDSTPAVFSPPQLNLPPPVARHDWTSCRPPRTRPSSPLADVHTILFRSPPRRSPRVSVLPSPPESSLTVSSHPITDYYRAARPVVSRFLASLVTDPRASPSSVLALTAAVADFASTRRLDYATRVVAAPPPRPLSVGGESALGCDVLEDRQFELEFLAAAPPSLCVMLLSLEGDPDALDIPTPRTANVVDGMWLFKVKRPPGSPPVFKVRYVARGSSQHEGAEFFQTFAPTPRMTNFRVLLHKAPQRGYELHSLDFSTAFLQGRLHEEIWLRRPPCFTDTFPPGTQWSLRRLVYGLRQSPSEWHDTLRSTLRDLGFRRSSADPSLFVHTGSTPFFILVYVDNFVFATIDRAALTEVKSELLKRHKRTDLGELQRYIGLQIIRDRAARTITLTQSHMVQQVLRRFGFQFSPTHPTPLVVDHQLTDPFPDEPFESSGPYAELVGCLIARLRVTASIWVLVLCRGGLHGRRLWLRPV